MPPSPLLSARRIKVTYSRDITSINTQKITDSTPRILPGSNAKAWWPALKHSRSAYKGLVPISPNTTPSAPSIKGQDRLERSVVRFMQRAWLTSQLEVADESAEISKGDLRLLSEA